MKQYFRIFLLLVSFVHNVSAWTMLDPSGRLRDVVQKMMRVINPETPANARSINCYMQGNFLRKPGLERCSIKDSPIEVLTMTSLFPFIQELGFSQEIFPKEDDVDTVLFFGSGVSMMRAQVEFIKNRCSNLTFKKIIFLTAERPLIEDIDGADKIFKENLAKTEHEAACFLIEEIFGKQYPVYFSHNPGYLATSNSEKRRANTSDTVKKWLDECDPVAENLLIVSVNPFIKYQYETILGFLKKRGWFADGGNLNECGPSCFICGSPTDGLSQATRSFFLNYTKNEGHILGVVLDTLARCLYTEISNMCPEILKALHQKNTKK